LFTATGRPISVTPFSPPNNNPIATVLTTLTINLTSRHPSAKCLPL
jgi:hypothetical protein